MRPVARIDSEVGPEARFHREFEDERGVTWLAGVRERPGLDFKGRFYFVATRKDDASSRAGPDVLARGRVLEQRGYGPAGRLRRCPESS